MNYKPNPLLYGANERFCSAFRLAVNTRFEVDAAILEAAVAKAVKRYPYFSVRPAREGENLILQSNPLPIPVFADDRAVTLGTEESNNHLLTFGCSGNTVFLDASHYIADGMGITPFLKTVLYLYVSEVYGDEGIELDEIQMPEDTPCEGEYAYPFSIAPVEVDEFAIPRTAPKDVYKLDPDAFDNGGLYSYYLRIPQKAMMSKAHPADGSPISFLTVMIYRALCALDQNIELPVVSHVQHQYRAAVNAPLSHDSLVCYVPVTFSERAKGKSIERQNTVVRGQVILGSERDADLAAVNRLISAFPSESASFAEKHKAMAEYAAQSINGKTFGISYVGKLDWSGLERYIDEVYAYIGEKHTSDMLLVEVMAVGDDFSISFMQSGKGERYLRSFIDRMSECDIPVSVVGEGRYKLCDTRLPN
jgi:hypothetical protein